MVTRNITLFTIDNGNNKTQLKNPYVINMDFQAGTIVIYVAVDNSFENDSYTVSCQDTTVLIKQNGNKVTIILSPNYNNETREITVVFEHNMDKNDTIPVLIRQTWQPYNIILKPGKVDANDCCSDSSNFIKCFSYVSKNGTQVEHTTYRVRDNIILNDTESAEIEKLDGLQIAADEVIPYIYGQGDGEIYAEEYVENQGEVLTPSYYIFKNDDYNIYIEGETYDIDTYRPYRYVNRTTNDVISPAQYKALPEQPTGEQIISQGSYKLSESIRVYNEISDISTPRYKYNPSVYRNTLTLDEYSVLSNTSKSGCQPLTYINIYDSDVEIINDEYMNLSRSERYYYQPNRYVVFKNDEKDKCGTVISSDEYETYPVEGKYDYYPTIISNDEYQQLTEEEQANCSNIIINGEPKWIKSYYRELFIDEYDNYPELGQIDYYPYQYIKDTTRNIIDFVEYGALAPFEKEEYRIYRYSIDTFTVSIKMWKNITDDDDEICDGVYKELTEDEKEKYSFYYEYETVTRDGLLEHVNFCKLLTLDQIDNDDPERNSGYEVYVEIVDGENLYKLKDECRYISLDDYRSLSERGKDFYKKVIYEPKNIITPSKYVSLPVYGKNYYKPYMFSTTNEDGEEGNITSGDYFNIPLTRSDYVVDSVTVIDDRITCETYNKLDDMDQSSYELCYRLDSIMNKDNDNGYLKDIVLELDVLCTGGCHDYVINGITRYKRSTTQTYGEDELTNEQINYKVNGGEEFVEESMPFKLIKQNSGMFQTINDSRYAKQKLFIEIYGWLDSTFKNGMLDSDVFYRVKLAHKDVIGLDATLKIEMASKNITLNDLTKNQTEQYAPVVEQGDLFDDEPPLDVIDDIIDDGSDYDIEFEPFVECDNMLVFPMWQSTKTIEVMTNPIDSAISVKYSGGFVKNYSVSGHTIRIKVEANPFGIERNCVFTVTNAEYPTASTTFIVKQLGE